MTPENFAYWLQGFFELAGTDKLTETQVRIIKDHLELAFTKVTPDRSKKKKRKKGTVMKPIDFSVGGVDVKADPLQQVDCAPAAPTINAEQIRLNIEEALKKLERERLGPYRTTCTWVGGGRDQKYC